MLFILTGDIQVGKTRWLMRTLNSLEESGVLVGGVLTPGVWRHRSPQEITDASGAGECGEYEKLGIDALLLPERGRISFARPASWGVDGADAQRANQSREAKLGWNISEDALAAINAHFDALFAQAGSAEKPGLLVVDELGRLELERNGGLTSALSMLDAGPTKAYPHALIVVRDWLLSFAHQRFAEAWQGEIVDLAPDEASASKLFETLTAHE
ncbi:MAG: hypothetical protein IJJ32_00835 [Eggerthellaceae bacterium]|nr:hypothetical protein [Eggerthellaceae bacterium]